MALHDESLRIIDLITSLESKSSLVSKRMRRPVHEIENIVVTPSHEQRLQACDLRPTLARISALDVLEKAVPGCLDAGQVYRILSPQYESITSSTIYRALKDLWMAGLLIRTEGAYGRAFYAFKPYGKVTQCDTLRCHCGTRLIVIEDQTLREHLRSLAVKESFDLDSESAFTVTVTCASCRKFRKRGH